MLVCNFKIKGIAPYGQSKHITSVKDTGESHDDFEQRTWRERMHVDQNGEVYIPGNAIKNMMADVAKHLSESVPGKGKATYTKHFKSGLLVLENCPLHIKADSIEPFPLFVPVGGQQGGGSRVMKNFPVIFEGWGTEGAFHVFDPILMAKPEKIKEYLSFAGKFIGLGFWRAARGGLYGRFKVEEFSHSTVDDVAA